MIQDERQERDAGVLTVVNNVRLIYCGWKNVTV